jgi:purine nucleosidase
MPARAIVIDTDPGQDDAVALLLAFACPHELDVRLVSTVAGNTRLPAVTRNALRIRDLAGQSDVPVVAGMDRPMLLPLETAEFVCGPDGLAGADLPEPRGAAAAGHAVDAIIAEARRHPPRGLTICALGPLCNIAMALRLAPDIAGRIGEIVVMGGAVGLGNMTPAAEFNFHVDPHAARVVLQAGVPVTLFGLQVTHQAVATPAALAAFAATGSGTARAVNGMLTRPRPGGLGTAAHPMHDPCVIAWLLWPDLFSGRDCHVTVETEGEVRGRSTIDWNNRLGRPANAFVAGEVRAAELFGRLFSALERLP